MTVQDQKVEFASAQWIEAIAEVLAEVLAEVPMSGGEVVISEEFTDPPAHLLPPGQSTIAWHFRISDAGVSIGSGLPADSTITTVVDYEAALPLARCVYGTAPEDASRARELREQAYRTGSRRGEETALDPELLQRLIRVHNEMAARTL